MFDLSPRNTPSDAPYTVAQALALVQTWSDLTVSRRRDLASGLSAIARLAGLPPDTLVLTPAALRQRVLTKPPSAFGMTGKRMKNLRSALRVVLRRLNIIDPSDTPLSSAWAALQMLMPPTKQPGIASLAHYCSMTAVAPDQLSDDVLGAYRTWLDERTITPRPTKKAGEARGAWNHAQRTVDGWPNIKLIPLRDRHGYIRPLADFPASFRSDLEVFCRRLAGTSLDTAFTDEELEDENFVMPNRRARPCRQSTIDTRKGHCRWAASALVATGLPIEEITSLASLVTPIRRTLDILNYVHNRNGRQPSAEAGHIADVLRMVAKFHVQLAQNKVDAIQEWGKEVKLSYNGMTEKNARCIRRMLEPAVEAKFLVLPEALIKEARKLREHSPKQAASIALRAMAIEFLTHMPIRVSNLTGLEIDRHLHRSNPPRGPFTYLRIGASETKNSRAIEMPIGAETAALLQEWIDGYRPFVATPGCRFLFPGHGTGLRPITRQGLGAALTQAMEEYTGVAVSPHQFRHLAAVTYLRANPGHYEAVRQFLGHADITTTTTSYCGVEAETVVVRHHDLIQERRQTLKLTGPAKTPGKAPKGGR